MDEVTFFYVGELYCIHLDTKYANFQEKIFAGISRKSSNLFIVVTYSPERLLRVSVSITKNNCQQG